MDLSEMQTRVAELEQQISALPAGSVTKKNRRRQGHISTTVGRRTKMRREKYIPAARIGEFPRPNRAAEGAGA